MCLTLPFCIFQLKSVGPKTVPFLKTLAIYFVLYGDQAYYESFIYCLIKCLPVMSLMIFVLLHGMSFSEVYRYSRRILFGLIFSALGDAFLVWRHHFVPGMACFAVSQFMYARAFGMKPLNPRLGLLFLTLAAVSYLYLLPGLEGPMVYLVGVYVLLIATMVWRAIARVRFFDEIWTWTKLSGCLGAICFAISDMTIAIEKFRTPVPFSHQIIMISYYAAQFGIALSVVDSQVDAIVEQTLREANGRYKLNDNVGPHIRIAQSIQNFLENRFTITHKRNM